MKYLFYISMHYATKNKLEELVSGYLKTIDRTIVNQDDLLNFFAEINNKIAWLHKENAPRCKPIRISFGQRRFGKQDYTASWNNFDGFNGHEICHIYVLSIQNKYQPAADQEAAAV